MRFYSLIIPLLLLVCSFTASADASFVVSDIRVEGLQRITPDSAFAALPIDTGDTVDDTVIRYAIRNLFQTGNFDDIRVAREGNVLVFVVIERPTIDRLSIEGNKIIETDILVQGLERAGLSEGKVFKRPTLDAMEMELMRQYTSQGRYDAKVETTVVSLPRNRVAIDIAIDEGSVATIKHINIVGNTVYSDKELLSLFTLKSSHWLSWIKRDDHYAREKLAGDLERLTSYYLDRGYINFTIDSTQVSIAPDRSGVYITINVTEGERFTIGSVSLSGHLALPEDQLHPFVAIQMGQVFSQALVTTTERQLTGRLGDEGYSFARVEGVLALDEANHVVNIKFFMDPGKRTYVRRIDFTGNEHTEDTVLRREMRQMEGAVASSSAIEQSRVRLERLGYFKQVEFRTKEVPGNEQLMDLDVLVEEQLWGNVNASIGYSQDSGIILAGGIEQDNFLGTGKKVGVGVNTSSYLTNVFFSYDNPYYTEDGVSRGFSLYYREANLKEINVANYSTKTVGTDVDFGYPLSETQRLGFGLGYAHTKIDAGMNAVQQIISSPRPHPLSDSSSYYLSTFNFATGRYTAPEVLVPFTDWNNVPDTFKSDASPDGFLNIHGDTYNNFTLTTSWLQSTLNRGFLPTKGASQSVSLEVSIPGSDLQFYKFTYNGQIFAPVTEHWVFRFRTRLGFGDGYGKDQTLPFFNNFFAGGFGSVRGYRSNTLGPRSTPAINYVLSRAAIAIDADGEPIEFADELSYQALTFDETTQKFALASSGGGGDPFGGNLLVEGGVELLFPLPFVKDNRSFRTAFFFDAGNVYSSHCGAQTNCSVLDLRDLRYSVGVGLSWITAFGPLTFSYAIPFNNKAADDVEQFQFAIGRSF